MAIKVSKYFKTNINKKIKKEVLKTANKIETYLNIDSLIVYGY